MATETPQPHSRAYVEEEIFLRSDEAQHVAKHAGRQAVVSLQKIAVVLGYLTKDKRIREVEALIDAAIDKTAAEIAAEMARVRKLIADNGISVTPQFNHPVTITVALTTPAAVAYYGLIRQLDELMFLAHQLWFGRAWHNQQRRAAGIQWQRRLVALATHINQTEQRAWKAFQKKKGRPEELREEPAANTLQEQAPERASAAVFETSGADTRMTEPESTPSAPSALAHIEETATNSEPARPGEVVGA